MRLHPSRSLVLFCALVCMALLASPVLAQQRSGRASTPGGFAEGRMMKRKAQEIGLSEDTVKKIDDAIKAGRAEEEKLREENVAAIEALNKILSQPRPSEKELMAASDEVGKTAEKSRDLKMKSVIEIRALLTDEQLEKFMELRQKATSRR